MNNKKGFTLVEMISVLVIMSVLFMISFPSILNAIKSTSIKLNDSEKIIVKEAVTDYLNNNDTYEQNNGDNYCVGLSALLDEGYLTEEEITEIDQESIVNVNIDDDDIIIDLKNICENETKKVVFKLIGNKSIKVDKGSTYSDPGYTAIDRENNDVNDEVVVKYYDKDMHELASINTQFTGKYIVEYILDLENKKYVLERYVEVVVSENPVIVHPGDTTIGDTEMTFDLLDGVSATDSEGKELGVIVKTNLTLGIPGKYKVEYTVTDKNNKTITSNRSIKISKPYSELILNGTIPKLDNGMIPVTIENNGTVKKANIYDEWYKYEDRRWANMVLVTDSSRENYKNLNAESIISTNDILGYFVWIPRYSYKISTSGTDTDSIINILFENKDTPKSSGDAIDEYFTHPGFTFGDEELNGIWVAKFETTGTANNPTVLPNVTSLRNQNISTQFQTAFKFGNYGIASESHMMKNVEWGATVYLSHSIYGYDYMTSYDEDSLEIRVNNSAEFTTGCGASEDDKYKAPGCEIPYGSNIEIFPQSTNSNITGIFDMNGGAQEYVMANTYNSIKSSGFEAMPDHKYYDLYTNAAHEFACDGGECLGHATFETSGWYLDYYSLPTFSTPWTKRGDYFSMPEDGGAFSIIGTAGGAEENVSFRVVIP